MATPKEYGKDWGFTTVERRQRRRELMRKPQEPTAVLTCQQVAEIMTQRGYKMNLSCVQQIEYRALQKLYEGLKELE